MQLDAMPRRVRPARIHEHDPQDVAGTTEDQFVSRERASSDVAITAADDQLDVTQTVIFTQRRHFAEHRRRVIDDLAEHVVEWRRHRRAAVGVVGAQVAVGNLSAVARHQTRLLCTRRITRRGPMCRCMCFT